MAARKRLFARFRQTALPTEWLAEMPTLIPPCSADSVINTISGWA